MAGPRVAKALRAVLSRDSTWLALWDPELAEIVAAAGSGLSWRYTGEIAEHYETSNQSKWNWFVLLIALYALLAIPFRGLLQPIFVLAAIPFGLIGALIGGETHGDGAAVTHGVLGFLNQLADQSGAVFHAAAVFIATGVVARVKEVGQQVAVGRVDIDHIETRIP